MCGCAGTKKVNTKPASTLAASGTFAPQQNVNAGDQATTMVQVEYMGPREQTFTIKSRVNHAVDYRFGNNPGHKVRAVFLGDAELLTSRIGPDGKPEYVQLASASLDARDPASFLGQAVT